MSRESESLRIPATYVRGGTSKGVIFNFDDLPDFAKSPGAHRDAFLMRVIGSPDPYGKQIDGMGGGSSSTSKVVILKPSERADHDVDYLFGQVSIDQPKIDWSGNCGNLTAAVAAHAVRQGWCHLNQAAKANVRIWQENISKTILARVPVQQGAVVESGDFYLDGVAFPAAEIQLSFVNPTDSKTPLFVTGNTADELEVPEQIHASGKLSVTLINAGIPTIFIKASDVGLTGYELQGEINNDTGLLEKLEKLRALGALRMGLIDRLEDAEHRAHTPKLAFVAAPETYETSAGTSVLSTDYQVSVRALSMGKLHHAMMGTAAVAIASAAAIPGTVLSRVFGKTTEHLVFGHPSGTMSVGAEVSKTGESWAVDEVSMSRSARVLMEGRVVVPRR